jgi:hypothetical protein
VRLIAHILLAVGFVGAAHANGRPAATNGVVFRPNDNTALYVRATFGLLISTDGCAFRWVCEQSIGYGGEFDPDYAIASDGTIFATTFNGLRVSRDGGCSFETATAELPPGAPGRVAEISIEAVDIGPTGEVWVVTGQAGTINDVLRSTDNGVTFSSRNLMSETIFWKSIAVAPSDPRRVYVTGFEAVNGGPVTHVLTSDNGGDTWTPLPVTSLAPILLVAAVDPVDPRKLFLRSGATNISDHLYRTTDGGATFTEVLTLTEEIHDVLIKGASTVLVTTASRAVYRSDDGGASFAPVAGGPGLGCLGLKPDGTVIGCAGDLDDLMAVGQSPDAADWNKILRFSELAGALDCPAGTPTHDVCDLELWPVLEQQFGVTGPTQGPCAVPQPDTGGGCCESGGASPFGLALIALATLWTIGRKRSP